MWRYIQYLLGINCNLLQIVESQKSGIRMEKRRTNSVICLDCTYSLLSEVVETSSGKIHKGLVLISGSLGSAGEIVGLSVYNDFGDIVDERDVFWLNFEKNEKLDHLSEGLI